jgi:hypothetical protein
LSFDIREVRADSPRPMKQRLFARLYPQLVMRAWTMGYEVVLGEIFRGPGEVRRLADLGKGHPKTLHARCLAGHVYLFRDGVFLRETEDYQALGRWWTQQHLLCRWGGDFQSFKDGVHFSVTDGGVS